jgi:hypothetical protein
MQEASRYRIQARQACCYEVALGHINEAIAILPDSPRLLIIRAFFQLYMKNVTAGVRPFTCQANQCLQLTHHRGVSGRGLTSFNLLSQAFGVATMQEVDACAALALDPDFAEGYYWRACARCDRGYVIGAAADMRTCIEKLQDDNLKSVAHQVSLGTRSPLLGYLPSWRGTCILRRIDEILVVWRCMPKF